MRKGEREGGREGGREAEWSLIGEWEIVQVLVISDVKPYGFWAKCGKGG